MKTILVVDDQNSVCQMLQDFLLGQGFHIITATDGQGALRKARQENPDMILLDIRMPDMNGYEFLRIFRQERQTPVILMTAREEGTDVMLGLELGADDCLFKPVEGKLVHGFEGVDVGQRLHVQLVSVDVEQGFIDFRKVNRSKH